MLSFYGLLEAALLVLNGIAILHRERFLKKYGLCTPVHSFDSEPGVKTQLINLILAVQTVMRSDALDRNQHFRRRVQTGAGLSLEEEIPENKAILPYSSYCLLTNLATMNHNRPVDLVTAFEYPTFKIPYEVLNQGFRNLHREMETRKSEVRKTSERLLEVLNQVNQEGNEPIPIENIRAEFLAAWQAWRNFQDSVRSAMSQMDYYTSTFLNSIQRVRLEIFPNENESEMFRWKVDRDRTCRLIGSYLIRCGRIRTAQILAQKTGLESSNIHELNVFAEASEVYSALRQHNTGPCLEWIRIHRARLKKNSSRLELMVRMQDVVDLIRQGHRLKALKYARAHLNFKEIPDWPNEDIREVNQVWALLGLNTRTTIPTFSVLLREDRYNRLADLFREEFWKLFDLPYQSAFSLALQCGLAAFKTPQCSPGGNSRCITCQPTVFTLADGLPHAHTGLSIIRCAFSGELLNEDNPPWMILKTGRVYGQRSLEQLTREDKVHCIKTDEWVSVKDVARLYIL